MIKIFKALDLDNSGTLTPDELYAGVLMIHLELAKYVGPGESWGEADSILPIRNIQLVASLLAHTAHHYT